MANPIITQPLQIDDFSGGKTDNYIAGALNQFQDAENFVLKRYGNKGKLITRPGSQLFDSTNYRIAASDRITSIADIEGAVVQFSGRNAYTQASGSWHTIVGPTSNPALGAGTVANYLSWARWNKHLVVVSDALCLPTKIYYDGSNWVARTLGLPAIDTSTVTITPVAGAGSYLYAFIRADSYSIDTVTFREVSAVATKTCSSAADPSISSISITNLPVLSNSTTGNYNTTTSTIEIYRTTNGGTTYFKVGQVTNGTTSYTDSTSDATLQTHATLYTTGGVLDFEQAPAAKYVVVTGDTAFYCGVVQSGTTYGNRIVQSMSGALYAAASSNYVDVTMDITGAGVVNTTPIVFCKSRMYRIEGQFDEFGQGGMVAREISNNIGCISHRSIITTKEGLYFASESGFYFTDGFNVSKISQEFNTSYLALIPTDARKASICGTYDPIQNRLWWAAQRDLLSVANDVVYIAHLEAPNLPFTTMSGGTVADNFAPTALHYFNGYVLRGDRRGYLFQHVDSLTTDPKIDTSVSPSSWLTSTIIYNYLGPAIDFGNENVRKWVPRLVVNADNQTNLSLQISSDNDNSGVFSDLYEIKSSSNSVWGDPDILWEDATSVWNYSTVISEWRRFPAGGLRCSYKQVRMTNSYTLIDSSPLISTATTNATLKTVTLDNVSKVWVSEAVDYYISFDNDSYGRQYKILERNSDTVLTIEDVNNVLTTTAGRSWKIYGYKRSEVLNLLAYVIDFAPLTQTQMSARIQG